MNSCACLSRSYVISALQFTPQPTSWTVIVPPRTVSTVFSPGRMSGGELSVGGKWTVSSLSLRDSAVTDRHMPQTCDLQPPPSTPPPSCCAPIKAELIKPQLIASAGGGMRRKKGGRGEACNYTLAFTHRFQHIALGWQPPLNAHASRLPITLAHAATVQSF